MTHAKVWQQYTACRHQDSNRLRGSSAGGRKRNFLKLEEQLGLVAFPWFIISRQSSVWFSIPQEPEPNKSVSLTQSPTTRNQNHVLGRSQQQPADENGGSFQGYWERNAEKAQQNRSDQRAKEPPSIQRKQRQQANGTSAFQKSTPGGHSKWQWIQTMTKKAIPLPRGNCGAILLGKGTRLFPHSLAALSKGLSVKQLDRRPLHQHQPFQTHEEHLREAAQQRQLLAAKATAYTKTYTLSGTEGVSLFSICTHAVQEPEHTVSR